MRKEQALLIVFDDNSSDDLSGFEDSETQKNQLGFELPMFPSPAHCDQCFSLKVDIRLVRGLVRKALKSWVFFIIVPQNC